MRLLRRNAALLIGLLLLGLRGALWTLVTHQNLLRLGFATDGWPLAITRTAASLREMPCACACRGVLEEEERR